jgi:hypothetical protein
LVAPPGHILIAGLACCVAGTFQTVSYNIAPDPQRRRNFIKSGNGLTVDSRFSVAQWHGFHQQRERFPESDCSSRFPFVVAKAHYYEIV